MSDTQLPIDARLVRNLIEWLEQDGRVPMIVAARGAVIGDIPGLPAEAEIVVLNVSARAIRGLDFGQTAMSFSTGFGPVHSTLSIPYGAILQVGTVGAEEFVGAILRSRSAPEQEPRPKLGPGPEQKRRFRIVTDDEA